MSSLDVNHADEICSRIVARYHPQALLKNYSPAERVVVAAWHTISEIEQNGIDLFFKLGIPRDSDLRYPFIAFETLGQLACTTAIRTAFAMTQCHNVNEIPERSMLFENWIRNSETERRKVEDSILEDIEHLAAAIVQFSDKHGLLFDFEN